MSRQQSIEGTVEHVTFVNPESGWTVLRLQVERRPLPVTVVGQLPGVQPGETLRLGGQWKQDRKYGEQFEASSCLTVQPSTLVGIQRYLGSGLIQGLGPVMAERLVKRFGLATLDVIDNEPWRLTHVPGIGPKRKERILEAWQEHKAIKEVMVFLQSHGVSTGLAVRIFKRYGPQAIALVKDNPFRLAEEIHGVGFRTADQIALNLGIARDAPGRAEAGALHVLQQRADEGHLYSEQQALMERGAQLLEIDGSHLERALQALELRGLIVRERAGDETVVFLAALHEAELGAARRLRAILDAPATAVELDVEAAIARHEARTGLTLAESQRAAIRGARAAKVLVITGGPGTGKTTIVNGLLDVLGSEARKVLLCAPTGRAAKRLAETTGREARTIHRLLEFTPQTMRFARDQDSPLEAQLLVVDEVSMVDNVLLHHLLLAVPDGCQLILVGDVDQLPSVGPGNVLADLIRSGVVPVVQLTEIFRQARASLIVVNAHRVNGGQLPQGGTQGRGDDFFVIEREQPEAALETIKELVARRIPRSFGLDPLRQIQVLTPMHKGLLGSRNLNQELQQLLNPSGEALARGGRVFRVGDKVMQLRNNYELDVYNGDIGRIQRVDEEQRQLVVELDGRPVTYDTRDLEELVLGYACTVHKSQGSEYPAVVLPLHTQHFPMLQRNLLYTALTRGRQLVVLVASRRALALAVRTQGVARRCTRLGARLREGAELVLGES